jgi:hypothetical protein
MYYYKLLIIITSITCMFPSYGYAQRGDWFNDPDGFSFAGSGSYYDPYLINSVTALAHLAERVNRWEGEDFRGAHFLLAADLDLRQHYWIPIGSNRATPFRGIFNGNGHTIRNLFIGSPGSDNVFESSGLFGYLGSGAMIVNLVVEGGMITGGGRESTSKAGCIAGSLECSISGGQDSVVIRNCHNAGVNIKAGTAETSIAGGIAGEAYAFANGAGAAVIVVEQCSSSGNVAGTTARRSFTGGIIGRARGHGFSSGPVSAAGLCLVYSSRNIGSVNGGTAYGKDAISSAGGIMGYGHGSGEGAGQAPRPGEGICSIKYCINAGSIKGGDAPSAYAHTHAGGILGYGDGYGYGTQPAASVTAGAGTFTLQSSANLGRVEGASAVNHLAVSSTGGVLGFASASAFAAGEALYNNSSSAGRFSMENCYSHAAIAARRGTAGGLAGCLATLGNGANRKAQATLRNSFAAGTINKSDTIFPVATGGLVGRMQKSPAAAAPPQVSNCLAALEYLNGALNRTCRIVAELSGITGTPPQALSNNYARVREGRWNDAIPALNGGEWNLSILSPPLAQWDFSNKTWIAEPDRASLPLLGRLPGQRPVPIPY